MFYFIVQSSFGQSEKTLDSINNLIEYSKDPKNSITSRLNSARRSSIMAKAISNDSILLSVNRNLSMVLFNAERYQDYVKLNIENFKLAKRLKDSTAVSVAASNLGSYYRYIALNDSSYYYYSKALKHYKKYEISLKKAYALFHIAEIQQIENLFSGAEEAAIKAIVILDKIPETQESLDLHWNLYNLLGIISRELGNYSKSLEYYEKSSTYAEKVDDGILNKVYSINNRAYVYRQMGNYDKSIELLESLIPLKSEFDGLDPTFYDIVIENIADTRFESGNYDFEITEKMMLDAYKKATEIDDEILKMNFALDLARLYQASNYLISSKKYANEALQISSKVLANEIRQEALIILSKISNGTESKEYLKEYIELSDSLLKVERNVRNKFARIEFETDKIAQENEKMSVQRRWLLIVSIALVITLIFLYIIVNQRTKNRQLKFEKNQQKANEEIYNLMLSQQDKVDEARANEKKRISQDMHDGILGRLFGTRLSLDSLNFVEGKEAIKSRAEYIKELQVIENDIRKLSHDLNTDFVAGSNFMAIVSELIEKQTNAYKLKSDFEYDDNINWEHVSNKTKINIYRIIQEALQNIYKHAEAKNVKIAFNLKNEHICLEVEDDGKGFDIKRSRKGIGIKNINSRASEFEGEVIFKSEKGNGTTLIIRIPQEN